MSECWTCQGEPSWEEMEPQPEEQHDDALANMRERAAGSLREFGRLLRVAAEVIALLIVIALPWLFRGATVAFAAWAVSCAYPALAVRLGGDPPAVLLALAVVLLPLAGALGLAQAAGAQPWGAFLAAGAAIYLLGQMARAATPLSAAFAVAAAFVGIVVHLLHTYSQVIQADMEEMEVSHAEEQSAG